MATIIDLATKAMQDAIKAVVDATKTVVDGIKTKTETIDTRTNTMNTNINTINTNVSTANANINTIKSDVATIKANNSPRKRTMFYSGSKASSLDTGTWSVLKITGSGKVTVLNTEYIGTTNPNYVRMELYIDGILMGKLQDLFGGFSGNLVDERAVDISFTSSLELKYTVIEAGTPRGATAKIAVQFD
ncbi:hypothetical protein MKY04_13520 [Lysinibacillus telephonicus]|uniref:hypothetical protein n=1 Tax=Lysinibacillus telephonicus TaxID=1714840 RepID=UPI0031FC5B4F